MKFYLETENIVFESYTSAPSSPDSGIRFRCTGKESVVMSCMEVSPVSPFNYSRKLVLVDIDKLRAAGVPEYVLDMIAGKSEELSHMRITRDCRILLTDYKIEIKMPPLDKALYLLYLRHPDGIRFKELSDHKDELMDLYCSVTGRDDMAAIRTSVKTLIDPLNNSVNEKCSRIKRAFSKALSPLLAESYYIDGTGGQAKKIALDRDLVTWETIIVKR